MRQFKVTFFKNSKYTYFGRRGCAHGMYSGGYNSYVYGIKYLFNIHFLECWGDFRDMKI